MEFDALFHHFNMAFQVTFLDLLLSGDNAVVIALACRGLAAEQKKRVIFFGTLAAILLRTILTSCASLLLEMPLLKLIGSALLLYIAIKLILDDHDDIAADPATASSSVFSAIGTIILADLAMSVDNVVGLAAVTQGDVLYLVLGLVLSIPLLMFGSVFVSRQLQAYPWLVPAGGALLGWVAGDMATTDPLIADWVRVQAPGLYVAAPILGALFVVFESRLLAQRLPLVAHLRPVSAPDAIVAAPAPQAETEPLQPPPAASAAAPIQPSDPAPQALAQPTAAVSDIITEADQPGSGDASDTNIGNTSADIDNKVIQPITQWIMGGGALIALVSGIYFVSAHWMPKPVAPLRYACSQPGVSVLYRHGANTISLIAPRGQIDGYMNYEDIDWGSTSAATRKLGFTPPSAIRYSSASALKLAGGTLDGMVCTSRVAGH